MAQDLNFEQYFSQIKQQCLKAADLNTKLGIARKTCLQWVVSTSIMKDRFAMKFSHYFMLFPLICLASNITVQAQNKEQVRLYTIAEFDSQGKEIPLSKPNLQLLSYLEKQLDIQFDLKRVPWKRAIENALSGDGMLMGCRSPKKERKSLHSPSLSTAMATGW